MSYISFNGQIIRQDQINFYAVERFRVADACFESMLYRHERIPLLLLHQERLTKTCALLNFQDYQISFAEIERLLFENNLATEMVRVRISLVRKHGANYKPLGKEVQVLIETIKLTEIFKPVNNLGFYNVFKKSSNALACIKSSNALIYVLAKQFAQENKYDEVLIANEQKEWIEASSSNVFVIKNKQIYTAKEDSGCVNGVCKDFLINFLDVQFVELTDLFLEEADELFLSNAVQLIQPVLKLDGKSLGTAKTAELIKNVKQKFEA